MATRGLERFWVDTLVDSMGCFGPALPAAWHNASCHAFFSPTRQAFELPRPVYTAQGAKKPCSASAEENRNERPQRAVGPEKMIQWLLERLFGANLFQKKSRLVVSPGFQRLCPENRTALVFFRQSLKDDQL
ncbi:unnamed protein product [Durusdinium trenchii]|uniref:Uncharacterized protein n=1 Tax=Durusdinium trenchii TaxID=1381693 RepID=A0ABP0PSH7_9DINO